MMTRNQFNIELLRIWSEWRKTWLQKAQTNGSQPLHTLLGRIRCSPLRCSIQADRQALPRGHGGKSTGPSEGLERSRRANWKHGYYSREAKAERSRLRAAMLALRDLCGSI